MVTYLVTNKRNGKFYIGSTTNLKRRKRDHLKCNNYPFQKALRKHPENFEWEIWEDDSEEPILEQALLDMWYGKKQCYNLSPLATRPPGNLGVPHTEETKQKISRLLKGKLAGDKNPSKRPEVREKISQSKLGKPRSEECKAKISKGARGKKWWVNAEGQKILRRENPGEGWKPGMKWRA